MQKNNQYKTLTDRLKKTGTKEANLFLLSSLISSIAIAMTLFLVFSLIELIAQGDTVFRTISAGFLLLSLLGLFAYFIAPDVLRKMKSSKSESIELVATRVGDVYPFIKDRLLNVLQLMKKIQSKSEFRPDNTSEELSMAAFGIINDETKSLDFEKIIEKKKIRKNILYNSAVAVLVLILFIVFKTSLGASLYRIANFTESFIPPAPFTLEILPKHENKLRDESSVITVKASGVTPERLTLYLKEKQQKEYDEYSLKSDSLGIFTYQIPSLKTSIEFYAAADWYSSFVTTDTGRITVTEKPFIRSVAGKITFPRYTGLSAKTIDNQSMDITALKGSHVKLNILSSKELEAANIVFISEKLQDTLDLSMNSDSSSTIKYDTSFINLDIDKSKANGSFKVSKSGQYYIDLEDKLGNRNYDPIKYSMIAMNDDYPTISLIQPVVDVQVTEEALLPIQVAVSDDYGFNHLRLYYRLVKSEYSFPMKEFKYIDIPIVSDELAVEIPYLWNLNDINISPDDIYEYYLEISDNDIVTGPKKSITQTLMVKLPSLEEVLDEVDEQHAKVDKELKDVLRKAEEVKKDIQELNKELLKKKSPKDINWKDKQKAEEIKKKQDELNKKLSDIQKQIENMTESLKEKNAISQETLEKYMELQKLMNEVNSPELKAMQQNMQKAMNQVTPQQMQEAMKQVKFDEEKFRKSIERTMNILKRLQAEQKADAIKKQSDELLEKQKELEEELKNSNNQDKNKNEELANKQEKLAEDFDNLSKEFDELKKLMEQLQDMPQDELSDAQQALNEQETKQQIQNAQQNIQKGNQSQAQKSQKKAMKSMQSFSEKMQELKDKMQEEGMKEAIRQMQKSISDMLELSERQEKTRQKTKSTDYNSTQFQQLLTEQAMVNQALASTINNLVELSQKSFAVTPQMGAMLGDALNNMNSAIEQLAERNTGGAQRNQTNAMSSMNNAIANMQAMLSRMQQSGSCSNPGSGGEGSSGQNGQGSTPSMSSESFMNKLQQMASEQQALNQAMQQQMSGQGSMSMEQQAQASRLAAQQGQLQKSLEQLSDEQRQSQMRDGKKPGLGNLEKIAQEMKETVNDIKRGRISQKTLKRQERILSRLLDATRSIHQRDRKSKREAKTGFNKDRLSPEDIDLSTQEGRTRAMQELLKSMQEGYTKDYQSLIRKYFEVINKQSESQNN